MPFPKHLADMLSCPQSVGAHVLVGKPGGHNRLLPRAEKLVRHGSQAGLMSCGGASVGRHSFPRQLFEFLQDAGLAPRLGPPNILVLVARCFDGPPPGAVDVDSCAAQVLILMYEGGHVKGLALCRPNPNSCTYAFGCPLAAFLVEPRLLRLLALLDDLKAGYRRIRKSCPVSCKCVVGRVAVFVD